MENRRADHGDDVARHLAHDAHGRLGVRRSISGHPPDSAALALFGHYTGKTWEYFDITGAQTLWKIWASGPTDIWMVGTNGKGAGTIIVEPGRSSTRALHGRDGALLHLGQRTGRRLGGARHGRAPTLERHELEDDPGACYRAVAVRSLRQQARQQRLMVGQNGLVGHYDSGGAWSLSEGGTKATLFSVWSNKPNEAWLVGGGGTILRWDSTGWF